MTALARRVADLDAEPWQVSEWSQDEGGRSVSAIEHFAEVMGSWTDAVVEVQAGAGAAIEPGAADTMVRGSRLLADIAHTSPRLISGPMDGANQHWTPIGRAAYTGEPPSEQRFVPPRADQPAAVKPAGVGLYTSTASIGGISMWRAFLGPGGSAVHPLPRYTWELTFGEPVAVAEISGAECWAEFVCAHPRYVERLIYPDWVAVSREYDAVHITLPTIAAAQGFALTTGDGMVAPAFWDVETTFWVTWRVAAAHLVEGRLP
jgi:hypothetical protein